MEPDWLIISGKEMRCAYKHLAYVICDQAVEWQLEPKQIPCFQELNLECFCKKEVVKTMLSLASHRDELTQKVSCFLQAETIEVNFLTKFKEVHLTRVSEK